VAFLHRRTVVVLFQSNEGPLRRRFNAAFARCRFLSKPADVPTCKSLALPDSDVITGETGRLARITDGAVVVRLGDTMLLLSGGFGPSQRDGVDFPVGRYRKFGSAGKIPARFSAARAASDYEI
jgi:polyribonucleotide nucleotidyltransferase